ncbi:TPA: hypothetical protein KDX74_000563 [Vibrio parahaemolyticus]|uniref:hypothetical protein n=1 Tax=Vibrio parahaemolyticus TaxID=670 RepID=UPI0015F6F14E|nr:hypothetical protein [Vibrio parahaemolyticus]MCI9703472.1 hypothetical protein [Vibrio parahaemolyticus]MDF5481610.1 hypothetical protein [Vibrio parahaemolyticus]MDG2620758.1 hypothetical protein [Vibrio parahaemolyticus]MDG2836460.1 hypothetical protein [Vibrio parahaemolyticus]HBC3893860.1 hypothetical protein [Vibrio parahaemolyticus]
MMIIDEFIIEPYSVEPKAVINKFKYQYILNTEKQTITIINLYRDYKNFDIILDSDLEVKLKEFKEKYIKTRPECFI